MLNVLIDNIIVVFGGKVFQKIVEISMGNNCTPLLADILLCSYKAEFVQSLVSEGNRYVAYSFNFIYRYIDYVLSINNPKFADNLSRIYPSELEAKGITETNNSASYLDIILSYDTDGHMDTSLYDKPDNFNFSITKAPNIRILGSYTVDMGNSSYNMMSHSPEWWMWLTQHYGQTSSTAAKKLVAIRLTVPWEERFQEANERKALKYADLMADCRQQNWCAWLFPVQIGCRGFPATSVWKLLSALGIIGRDQKKAINRLRDAAERASCWLWHRRDEKKNGKPWVDE
ncbi:hypothetical protein FSP39_010689 [Pinctada imbricata]|uniref:Uncharacterized protein n=1 Tax=Pinctada imbricata TaxID=66713 RepID=A0AA88XF86_PINIB|nr:hypothetical protein FSP39_010689 [Pinctada imbricata]